MRIRPTIAVTSGEPAGIGPELVAMLAVRQREDPLHARLVIIGDRTLLAERAARIGLEPLYGDYDRASFAPIGGLVEIWNQPLDAPVTPGRPDTANAHAVHRMLATACDACSDGDFDALVTGPVQKSVLADAGLAFSGHTEFFAERTGTPRGVMMLVGGGLRVALVTTHLPLASVPAAITSDAVEQTIAIVDAELRATFGIRAPRIAVCGLNPHAGEAGHLGNEDREVVAPAIEQSRTNGITVDGPLPADTAFVPSHARNYDAIVAMYHDQGLPVLKAASFGGGVNVTLGLPFVRTSVDHGTALDLAADGARAKTADPGSLYAAVELAIDLAQRATAAAVASHD